MSWKAAGVACAVVGLLASPYTEKGPEQLAAGGRWRRAAAKCEGRRGRSLSLRAVPPATGAPPLPPR